MAFLQPLTDISDSRGSLIDLYYKTNYALCRSKELVSPGRIYMKNAFRLGLALAIAVSFATLTQAQDKKQLVFVVNGASDFWKIAEAGVRKAQEEMPNFDMQFKYPEQAAAAIQQRLMDDLVA